MNQPRSNSELRRVVESHVVALRDELTRHKSKCTLRDHGVGVAPDYDRRSEAWYTPHATILDGKFLLYVELPAGPRLSIVLQALLRDGRYLAAGHLVTFGVAAEHIPGEEALLRDDGTWVVVLPVNAADAPCETPLLDLLEKEGLFRVAA